MSDARWARPAYRNWFLALLTLAYALNFIDRQLLSILAQPIKAELSLSDSQLGLLGGIYFALFYVSLGVPIARLSDRTNRVRLIAVAITWWSVATATCGLAQRFWHLAVSRMAVAIGESGGTPPSYSLVADLFPRERRAGAIGTLTMGAAVGTAAGLAIGGAVAHTLGWRMTFVVIGLPGVLLAALILATLREPPRGFADGRPPVAEPVGIATVARLLFGSATFPCMAFGIGTASICGYAMSFWMPSFLIRSFDMTMAEVGWRVALASGIGGALGSLTGGFVCDRLARYDRRWWLWGPAATFLLNLPITYLLFGSTSATTALFLLGWVQFNYHCWDGPGHSMVQSLVGQRMRAVAASLFLLVVNLTGLGLGPAVVGFISDATNAARGAEALRYALFATTPAFLIAALLLLIASRTLRRDLDRAPD